jgi:hypothetical protein
MEEDSKWWRFPEGPEREAAKRAVRQREAARRKRTANIPPERLHRVEFKGTPALKGPSKVAHSFTNEAEEQVAIRLARTYAPPFPYHLLTAEIRDGQLILGCKTLDYRFPIRLDMDVPPFLFVATVEHLREAELEHRAAMAQESGGEVPHLENETTPVTDPEPERNLECDSIL